MQTCKECILNTFPHYLSSDSSWFQLCISQTLPISCGMGIFFLQLFSLLVDMIIKSHHQDCSTMSWLRMIPIGMRNWTGGRWRGLSPILRNKGNKGMLRVGDTVILREGQIDWLSSTKWWALKTHPWVILYKLRRLYTHKHTLCL